MSDDFTPRLGLPYLLANQAQKHVTLNESLSLLDGLVMGRIVARDLNTPPDAPQEGEAWLIGPAPEGAWSAWPGRLVLWQDNAWHSHQPQKGWRFWDETAAAFILFTGETWQPVLTDTQNLSALGLATQADTDNPLSARLNAALFTAHETEMGGTGDLHLKLNKENQTDTAALLFQSGFGGRAEFGLLGDDAVRLKVSANNLDWHEAFIVEPDAARLGLGTYPDSDARFTVFGRTRLRSETAAWTWHESGRVELSESSGGPLNIQATSPGSALQMGAVTNGGSWRTAMLSLQPDEPALVSAHKLRPQDDAQTDLGAPDRAWRDLYLQNPPLLQSQPDDPKSSRDLAQADTLLSALRPVQYVDAETSRTQFSFIAAEFGAAVEASGFTQTGLWQAGQTGIPMTALIPLLVAGYQTLSKRVLDLESEPSKPG